VYAFASKISRSCYLVLESYNLFVNNFGDIW
jgi:hypothetical protein